jgi:predicted amidohydrolase YtcJ
MKSLCSFRSAIDAGVSLSLHSDLPNMITSPLKAAASAIIRYNPLDKNTKV